MLDATLMLDLPIDVYAMPCCCHAAPRDAPHIVAVAVYVAMPCCLLRQLAMLRHAMPICQRYIFMLAIAAASALLDAFAMLLHYATRMPALLLLLPC